MLAAPDAAPSLRAKFHAEQAIAYALRIYCEGLAAGTRVVTRPLWFMTALDRTVLRGRCAAPLS
jgi:hypothetical protein